MKSNRIRSAIGIRFKLFTLLAIYLFAQSGELLHAQSEAIEERPATSAEQQQFAAIDVLESAVYDINFLLSMHDNVSNNARLLQQLKDDYFPLFDHKVIAHLVLKSHFSNVTKIRRKYLECLVSLTFLNFHLDVITEESINPKSLNIAGSKQTDGGIRFLNIAVAMSNDKGDSKENFQITYRLMKRRETSNWKIIDITIGSVSARSSIKSQLNKVYDQAIERNLDATTQSEKFLVRQNNNKTIDANQWCKPEAEEQSESEPEFPKQPQKTQSNLHYEINTTLNGQQQRVYLEVTPDGTVLYQDDIILDTDNDVKGAALRLDFRNLRLWRGATVPYLIDESVPDKKLVLRAIAAWQKKTPVRFIEANTNSENWLIFTRGDGCRSSLGMVGGSQFITLSDRCSYGAVLHEIGHALGLIHEHSRIDRDDFITVNQQNILRDKARNFYKHPTGHPLSDDYCYGSIMHYSNRAFAKNRSLKTIEVKGRHRIGQRKQLSSCDIARIQTLYTALATEEIVRDASKKIDKSGNDLRKQAK